MHVFDLIENKKVNVKVSPITKKELKKLENFEFEWEKELRFEVFKLELTKTKEVLGLLSIEKLFEELRTEIRLLEISKPNIGKLKRYDRIAGILIAFACKESFISGFYGFVSLIPKTRLIDHYINKYGFKQFGRHLSVELEMSENLMNKYLIDEK